MSEAVTVLEEYGTRSIFFELVYKMWGQCEENLCKINQCCGSGSAFIWLSWKRIRNGNTEKCYSGTDAATEGFLCQNFQKTALIDAFVDATEALLKC